MDHAILPFGSPTGPNDRINEKNPQCPKAVSPDIYKYMHD